MYNLSELMEIIRKVLNEHGVRKASLFGSYARGTSGTKSDIDILVELDEDVGLLEFIEIKQELEDALGKRVDLVEYSMIKPAFKERILKQQLALI